MLCHYCSTFYVTIVVHHRKIRHVDDDLTIASIIFPAFLGIVTTASIVSLCYVMRDKTWADVAEEMQEKHPELYDQTLGVLIRLFNKVRLQRSCTIRRWVCSSDCLTR